MALNSLFVLTTHSITQLNSGYCLMKTHCVTVADWWKLNELVGEMTSSLRSISTCHTTTHTIRHVITDALWFKWLYEVMIFLHNLTENYSTLQPQSNGPYSNTVIGTLGVDGWAVTFWYSEEGTRRGRSPPRPLVASKCNSPPVNGQCTNFVLFDVAL